MAGAVVSRGRVVWTGASGAGAEASDVYSLASLSKPWFATAALRLSERGRLPLSAPISRWLRGRIPAAAGRVTVRELLGQTSGLPDYLDDARVSAALEDPRHRWREAELLRAIRAPRRRGTYEYSNTNYVLLGAVLRRAAHESAADVLRDQVLRPLGLRDTAMRRSPAFAARVAGGRFLPTGDWGPLWTDGGIVATAADVGRFLDGLLVSGRLLRPDTLRAMLTPAIAGDYGLGVYETTLGANTVFGHDGAFDGWYAEGYADREHGTTIVVLQHGGRLGELRAAELRVADAARAAGLL